jgi:hypothetical protein
MDERRAIKKWIAPILRNLADTPERAGRGGSLPMIDRGPGYEEMRGEEGP